MFSTRNLVLIYFLFILAIMSFDSSAQTKNSKEKNGQKSPVFFEFKELAINVKIQEPEVLFILEKPDILMEPFEKEMNFTEKIDDPIINDNLF